MNVKYFLFCFSTLSATVFIQNDCLYATQNINKTNPLYIDRNSYVYKNINYNVNKFIKLATKKYGTNYWGYEAITSGNEYSSSIENLKKLLVLTVNSHKQEKDRYKIFQSLYSKISNILDNLVIDKSLTIDKRLKTDACRQVFACMNALTVYTTLCLKFSYKNSQFRFKTYNTLFDHVCKKRLFDADEDNYQERIMSRLLEIFDNNKMQLKKYLFHDWKIYLYQFSVIASGSEHDLAFPYPSTVLSTVINLGIYDGVSKKVDCAKTFLKDRSVWELGQNWLNNKLDTKNFFNTVHTHLDTTEAKLDFDEIIRKISNWLEISFFPDLVSSHEDRYYDYEYINLLYNFGKLQKAKEGYTPNFRLKDFVLSQSYHIFKKVQKQKLIVHVAPSQDLNIINFFNICIIAYIRLYTNNKFRNYEAGSKANCATKVEEIILKLFKYVSDNNLNNCHDTAFDYIFVTISRVGWDKTFSMLNDVLVQPIDNKEVKKDDFYSISQWIYHKVD